MSTEPNNHRKTQAPQRPKNQRADWLTQAARYIQQNAPWMLQPLAQLYQAHIPSFWRNKLSIYGQLMRVDKPIGTYLLFWPTLWALLLANQGAPALSLLLIFAAGTFVMRSAGCVINDFADRNLDGKVSRTQARPLAQGLLSKYEALGLFFSLLVAALLLVLLLKREAFYWSIGAVLIATLYPFMKRYTYFPQVVLGAAFAWSIPMAYVASAQAISAEVWLLYLSTLLWVIAYDTFYAMVDRKDDLKVGIKSTAILFGEADLAIIGLLQTIFLFGMLLVGIRYSLHWPYFISWLIAASLIGFQFYISRKRKPEQCFRAFLNNHYVGMSLAIGMAASYLTA